MKAALLFVVAAISVSASAVAPSGAWADEQVPQRDTRKPATPVANAAPAPEGTGTISGTVVADASSAPVRLAYVVLVGVNTGVLKVTSTDQTGKFAFTKLPVDRYTVGASKLPYLGAVAGARRPARPGIPVALGAGATVSNVTIRLPMGASISGTVFNERGQPAYGVAVGVVQRKMQNGERVLSPGQTTFTDDRGFYRLHSLVPGEYLVSALPLGQPVNARALTDAEVDAALRGTPIPPSTAEPTGNMTFAPVYFPGTTRLDDAQSVLVATGEDRQNVDLKIERVRTAQISGTVISGDGQPLQNVVVSIATTAGTSTRSIFPSIRVGPDGRFGMTSTPGSYTLTARTLSTTPDSGQFAFAIVDISGIDVTNVQMTLQPALAFTGTLKAAGVAAPPTLAGHLIQARPLSQASAAALRFTPTNANGVFTVSGLVPGRYIIGGQPFFGSSTASVAWGLESVMVDGKDVTDLPITIAADSVPKEVTATMSDRWQELSGRLTDGAGAGVSDYTVMVFPVNDAYWVFNSRRIVTTQPGTDGRFTLGGPGPSLLPAGEYYLAAVTDVSKDEQYDPAFLQSIIGSAIKITIAPGGRQTQDLRVR
jgi:hypothetical protein